MEYKSGNYVTIKLTGAKGMVVDIVTAKNGDTNYLVRDENYVVREFRAFELEPWAPAKKKEG
jgi:hypothetical protein